MLYLEDLVKKVIILIGYMENQKTKVHIVSCRGTYKPKDENIKKLKVYLNKLENGK
jgi:hypothetical protein